VLAQLAIVVWEFNQLTIALSILAAVPFSLSGAIGGLFLTHSPFGFTAFLGLITLGGVVTNHAIMFFEYARHASEGRPITTEDLIVAGRQRLRPILLTVLLSIGGLLPLGIGGGNLWPPMAWSLIFGLLLSVVLAVVIVPSCYTTLQRINP
jgi:multidrug efflux pump subunit AcrB